MASVEFALRDRELKWAEKRVVAEQLARARESVLRELKTWGISGSADSDAAAKIKADEILRSALTQT
jgi:hypothetical protein